MRGKDDLAWWCITQLRQLTRTERTDTAAGLPPGMPSSVPSRSFLHTLPPASLCLPHLFSPVLPSPFPRANQCMDSRLLAARLAASGGWLPLAMAANGLPAGWPVHPLAASSPQVAQLLAKSLLGSKERPHQRSHVNETLAALRLATECDTARPENLEGWAGRPRNLP